MTLPLTLPFDDAACLKLAAAGGKGASLAELVQAGLRVPPGYVVTTAAFEAFMNTLDVQARCRDSRPSRLPTSKQRAIH